MAQRPHEAAKIRTAAPRQQGRRRCPECMILSEKATTFRIMLQAGSPEPAYTWSSKQHWFCFRRAKSIVAIATS